MEEGPENGKESSHSAHANGMNESNWQIFTPNFSGGSLKVGIYLFALNVGKISSLQIPLISFQFIPAL